VLEARHAGTLGMCSLRRLAAARPGLIWIMA
jgi:hypothetical protein